MRQMTRMMVLAWWAVGVAVVGCKRGEQAGPTPVPAPAPTAAPPAPPATPPPAPAINDSDVPAGGDGGTNPWAETAVSHRGSAGATFTQDCPAGGTLGPVWGTDVYSDDSSICSAAVHAGRIIVGSGGPVLVFVQPARATYVGSARHGVTSLSRAASPGSFSFSQMLPSSDGTGTTTH